MYQSTILLIVTTLTLPIFNAAIANEPAPWGRASINQTTYRNQKVVYDLDANSKERLANILARTGYLSKLNGDDPFDNKIIVVIHGDSIPFFSIKHTKKYRDLMELAYSQTLNGTIEFRMCEASAHLRGYESSDIHGFVSMVPMADAEIIRLQNAGYSYMR
ncbi:MAG: DsrE family protein [Gammaproteobacteria bacterium]|jgi:intracellular sulfur oxidation DsrE/DsrF family protein